MHTTDHKNANRTIKRKRKIGKTFIKLMRKRSTASSILHKIFNKYSKYRLHLHREHETNNKKAQQETINKPPEKFEPLVTAEQRINVIE